MKAWSRSIVVAVALVAAGFVVRPAQAYPIFFRCDAEGKLNEFLHPDELTRQMKHFAGERNLGQDGLIRELCGGVQQCQDQFRQMLLLAGETEQAARKLADSVERNTRELANERFQRLQGGEGDLQLAIARLAGQIHACHQVQKQIDPDRFLVAGPNGRSLALFHPFDNEYRYVSGCTSREKPENCEPKLSSVESVREFVAAAVAAGADPYLALGLAYMENTPDRAMNLSLDPVANYAEMGCLRERVKDPPPGMPVLDAFGPVYRVQPSVKNPKLAEAARLYLDQWVRSPDARGFQVVPGQGRLCSSGKGLMLHDRGDSFVAPDSCCVELPYRLEQSGTLANSESYRRAFDARRKLFDGLTRVLTLQHVAGRQRAAIPGDVAHRIQSFNGRATFFARPHVSLFRSGVNLAKDPQYGYQTMDFVVNALMPNPALRRIVDEAQSRVRAVGGKAPRSILCEGRPSGTYHLDSESYMKAARDTPRLERVATKTWSEMGRLERLLMWREFEATMPEEFRKGISAKASLSDWEQAFPEAKVEWLREFENRNGTAFSEKMLKAYRRDHAKNRNTVGKASSRDWDRLSDEEVSQLARAVRPPVVESAQSPQPSKPEPGFLDRLRAWWKS